MENKPSYYLLAELDDAAQSRLGVLSDELTAQGLAYERYTPYHITLAEFPPPDDAATARIERVCASASPFGIGLGYVGLFGLAVLFIAPCPCAELLTLETGLCGRPDGAPDGWVPHVTMRMGEPAYTERAAAVLARSFEPFAARIERLGLYECGDGYATLARAFTLGNGAA
jgi:hypothetical protein